MKISYKVKIGSSLFVLCVHQNELYFYLMIYSTEAMLLRR